MKKIFMALGVASIMLASASCSSKATSSESANADGVDKAFIDTLSRDLGYMNGAMIGGQIKQYLGPDSIKLSKADFLRGFKSAFMADTADVSYMLGMQFGMQSIQQQSMMRQNGIAIDRDAFYKQLAAAFNLDSVPKAEMEQLNEELNNFMQRAQGIMMAHQQQRHEALQAAKKKEAEENVAAGKAFVEKAKAADNTIKTTPSGLSYKVVKEGTGAHPAADDSVKVIYTGRHIDGTEFDSSKGEPAALTVNGTVRGFGEALQLMSKGAKYTVYIPGELAYGMNGGNHFKPNEMLVFDIELVDFSPRKKK